MPSAESGVADLRAFAQSRIFFGHQSVGSNILDGITGLYAAAETSGPLVVESADATGSGPSLVHTHVGTNADPYSKIDDFAAMTDGLDADWSGFLVLKLCFADVHAATDIDAVLSRYNDHLSETARRLPRATIMPTTVPITVDRGWKGKLNTLRRRDVHFRPADNVARHRYNESIRLRYRSTGRLFDIAQAQAGEFGGAARLRRSAGLPYAVLRADFAFDAGHLNTLGARAVASEFIRVIAANSPRQ